MSEVRQGIIKDILQIGLDHLYANARYDTFYIIMNAHLVKARGLCGDYPETLNSFEGPNADVYFAISRLPK